MKQVEVNNITSAINGCKMLWYDMPTIDNTIIIQNKQITIPPNANHWELYTIQGKLIEQSNSIDRTIYLDHLKNGLYIFKWNNFTKNYSYKLCVF